MQSNYQAYVAVFDEEFYLNQKISGCASVSGV